MTGLALAAAIASTSIGTAPQILHYQTVFSYPKGETADGMVRALLTFNPRGRVIHCDIVLSANSDKVDGSLCKWLSSAVAVPAKDADGNPAYGAVVLGVTVLKKDNVTAPVNADLSLAVNHMPAGAPLSLRVQATLAVDNAGVVQGCSTFVSDSSAIAPLGRATCQMAHGLTLKPAMSEAGKPVPSMQSFVVEFSAADAPVQRTETIPIPKSQSKFPM